VLTLGLCFGKLPTLRVIVVINHFVRISHVAFAPVLTLFSKAFRNCRIISPAL
jgi:hypothetical protein